MPGWAITLGVGLVTGAALAAGVLSAKGTELASRGQALQASLTAGGDDLRSYFLSQRASFERQLSTSGRQAAETAARRAGEQYLADEYGLTAARVAAMRALAERWT